MVFFFVKWYVNYFYQKINKMYEYYVFIVLEFLFYSVGVVFFYWLMKERVNIFLEEYDLGYNEE